MILATTVVLIVLLTVVGQHAGTFTRIRAKFLALDVDSRRRLGEAQELERIWSEHEAHRTARDEVLRLRIELAQAEARLLQVDPAAADELGVKRLRGVG